MPELPEVEIVCQGLNALLPPPCRFAGAQVRQAQLRRPVSRNLHRMLQQSELLRVRRRAKYLIWEFAHGALLNHLGMTGSWRLEPAGTAATTHDHVLISLVDGRQLIYRDPRRFGILEWCPAQTVDQHPSLRPLGPEPLGPDFTLPYLRQALSRRRGAIKAAIMEQKVVVGVGNIYAAEALFRAGIRPQTVAASLGPRRCQRLWLAIREILAEAIAAGGSTIRDFRQAGGSQGYFQHRFLVYGREGLPCQVCGSTLRGSIIGGRASTWCPRCQR